MIKTDVNIRDSFKVDKVINRQRNITIANDFNKAIMEKLFQGHTISLPGKLGLLQISGKKHRIRYNEDGNPILPIDWKATNDLWKRNPEAKESRKRVFHLNSHTDGVVYTFFWSKKQLILRFKSLYTLKMTRANNRMMSKLIKSGKEYFIRHK